MRRREATRSKEADAKAKGNGLHERETPARNEDAAVHDDETKKRRSRRTLSIVRIQHFFVRYFRRKPLTGVANTSLTLCAIAFCFVWVSVHPRPRGNLHQNNAKLNTEELAFDEDLADREESIDIKAREFQTPMQDTGEPDEYTEAMIEFDEHVASLKAILEEELARAGVPWVQKSDRDLYDRGFDKRQHLRGKARRFEEMQFDYASNDYYDYDSADWDPYYNFDDDEGGRWAGDESYLEGCRRTNFHRLHHPTCNSFHELDLSHEDDESVFLGEGEYRATFRIAASPISALERYGGGGEVTSATFKSIVLGDDYHDGFISHMEMQRLDALVMTLLYASPRATDTYGHCAMALMTEYAPTDIESTILPTDGDLPPDTDDEHMSQNDLSVKVKLQLALEMAQAIAEMHGYREGVIMHVDITRPDQFRRGADGVLKIIDFNRAEVLLYNEEDGNYCAMTEGSSPSVYRAPEEIGGEPIDEKADVYNYGSMVYTILTGLWLHSDMDDDEEIREHILEGWAPSFDKRFSSRSFGEAVLAKVMDECWWFEPDDRPDIFWVVKYLEGAIETNALVESRGMDMDEWIEYV